MRLWRLLGLWSNAGHPESVVKSGTSGKELGNGADKWQPWLATRREAPALRLWGAELKQGEEKNVFPMPFFSFMYYCCFRNLNLPLSDNAPEAPPSPPGVKPSHSWLQTNGGCPSWQRGPWRVAQSCGLRGEQYLPSQIQPQGLEKQKAAGMCTCTYTHVHLHMRACMCVSQIHPYMHILPVCVCIYCIYIYVCTNPSCFKQAGVWEGRGIDPESRRGR